jgi:hypothetical protein
MIREALSDRTTRGFLAFAAGFAAIGFCFAIVVMR